MLCSCSTIITSIETFVQINPFLNCTLYQCYCQLHNLIFVYWLCFYHCLRLQFGRGIMCFDNLCILVHILNWFSFFQDSSFFSFVEWLFSYLLIWQLCNSSSCCSGHIKFVSSYFIIFFIPTRFSCVSSISYCRGQRSLWALRTHDTSG